MTEDIRWQQRFENLTKALLRLEEALAVSAKEPSNAIYQIGMIGAFTFTFELAWKTLKDYLKYGGIHMSLPREVIKQAFHYQLIADGQLWIDMLDDRNLLAHSYDEGNALAAGDSIRTRYIQGIQQVHALLASKLSS